MPYIPFRFNEEPHEYRDSSGKRIQSITGILAAGGHIDDRWYTEESSERGRAVHKLTADFDLGALEPAGVVSAFRPWLLSHVKLMSMLEHEWAAVEVALACSGIINSGLKLAGRLDRRGRVYGFHSILEIKSGSPTKAHPIQTALQALLVEEEIGIPAETIHRYCEYLEESGRFYIEQHKNLGDFREARRLIRRFCE